MFPEWVEWVCDQGMYIGFFSILCKVYVFVCACIIYYVLCERIQARGETVDGVMVNLSMERQFADAIALLNAAIYIHTHMY